MKLIALSLLLSQLVFGQATRMSEKHIDSIIEKFEKNKFRKGFYFFVDYREYDYSFNKKIEKIIYSSFESDTLCEQVFYLKGGELIYATDFLIVFYMRSDGEIMVKDSTLWSTTYYFSNKVVFSKKKEGKGYNENPLWKPQENIFETFTRIKQLVFANIRSKKYKITRR